VVGCVLVVLGDSSYVSCSAVMSVHRVGSVLYRVNGVYVMLSSVVFQISDYVYQRTYVSFICNLSLLILYMLYLSNVFKYFPFFSVVYNVHSILYTRVYVFLVEYVVRISRIAIIFS
jgi:hypothetical protein